MIPILAILFILIQPFPSQCDPLEGRTIASPKVVAAMKFHGIRSTTEPNNQAPYFWRDKKKCLLYTEAFNKHWKKIKFKKKRKS